jgi:hypothetical protein
MSRSRRRPRPGRVLLWDTECPGGAQSFASPTCSSIAAAPGAFAEALGAY